MLTIDLTPFQPGQHELALEPEAEELDLSADDFERIEIHLRLDYQPRRLVMHLAIQGQALLECDRTLEDYREAVGGEHTVVFMTPEELPSDPDAIVEDVRVLPEPGEPLDLTTLARDTLLLALPVRRVAPGAEDRDIQLVFGRNEDEPADPRWDALKRLREKS